MWCNHPFNQRNKATKNKNTSGLKAEGEEGRLHKILKRGVGNIVGAGVFIKWG